MNYYKGRAIGLAHRDYHRANPKQHSKPRWEFTYIPGTTWPLLYRYDGEKWEGYMPNIRKQTFASTLETLKVLAYEKVKRSKPT